MSQNRIGYGHAPPAASDRGYAPRKRLEVSKVASAERPLDYDQIIQITVDASTFGTESSNNFERHHVGFNAVNQGSMMDLRLFQLLVHAGWRAKELHDMGCSKKEKQEPKIIGYRGQRADNDFYVDPHATVYAEFNSLEQSQIEAWAAEKSYQIVPETTYAETWEEYARTDSNGEGRIYVFIEAIPKDYDVEELMHAAAYRLWIIFEKGCGLDINGIVQEIIKDPMDENKKKGPIKHFDQFRLITNSEKWRQHVSHNRTKSVDTVKANPSIDLTNEQNPIAPKNILNPKKCFENVLEYGAQRISRVNDMFPAKPDARAFQIGNYVRNDTQFIVPLKQRKFVIEMTSMDLKPDAFMQKYKPDVWLFYILKRQLSQVLQRVNTAQQEPNDVLDQYNIDTSNDYSLNGHAFPNIWPESKNFNEGHSGKAWEEGNHDVMRLRTITHHQEVPLFNEEMKVAATPMDKQRVFNKYFKKSATSFARVLVPDAIVDNATYSLINYPDSLKTEHNYSIAIEPAWKFQAKTEQFFDLFLSKMSTGLEFCRFVATQHFKIIFMWLGSGCSKSLIQEKSHFTLQGPGGGGKSNAMNEVKNLKTPGTVQTLTHSSTQAMLDMDCFNTIVQEHEQDPDTTGQGGNRRSNEQLKKNEIRKNMKTNGENKTTRLEKPNKDSPMRTIIKNSIHSKVFMGCTNRPLSERDEASRSRDCELILPKISREGKDITTMRNAEAQQTTQQKEAAERFAYLFRSFDVLEHRVRAGQDQPLFMPRVTTVVWTDVLDHMQEHLDKITDISNLVRGKGRMMNCCETIIIMEAFTILFFFEPSNKHKVFYLGDERIVDGDAYEILSKKEADENGLHAEKEIELYSDGTALTDKIEKSNGEGLRRYMVNLVKGQVMQIDGIHCQRNKVVADITSRWEFEDEYVKEHPYDVGDVVSYRQGNLVYKLECLVPGSAPHPGGHWAASEAEAEPWDPDRRYVEGDLVEGFEAQRSSLGVDPRRSTAWKVLSKQHESLLGKYYEQDMDVKNVQQQYDIASLLYCTVPNAITTVGMNQDEILPQGIAKFIKQLCNFARQKLMEVSDSEEKRYNHCMPTQREGMTTSKSQVDVNYICLGDDYVSGITKLLETNFTPGYIVQVDEIFIHDSLKELKNQSTKHVQEMPDSVRVKQLYFRVEDGRDVSVPASEALLNGKCREGYRYEEEWQRYQRGENYSGGGWRKVDLNQIPVQHDKPKKKKIHYNYREKKWYIYVPWVHEVTKKEDGDPFRDAILSYKFKSNDADERMHIMLGTPYEGMVTSRNGEKKTCIPWVSNKVVLEPDCRRKILYKHGQITKEAADLMNVHESQCEQPSEEILTNHIDQYANLHHQKHMMKNASLQDVVLTQDFADAFRYCSKYDLLKEAHSRQPSYRFHDYPREMADVGYKDQMSHKYKKRPREEDVPQNLPNVRPRIEELSFE